MKTCPKCGKANDVMRKFCRACGASLLKKEEPPTPETVEEPKPEPVKEDTAPTEAEPLFTSAIASAKVEEEEDSTLSDLTIVHEELEEAEEWESEEDVEVAEPEVLDYEEGREVVKDILEKVRAAEARTAVEDVPAEPETTEVALEDELSEEEIPEPPALDEPEVEAEVEAEEPIEEPMAPPEEPPPEDLPPVPPAPTVAVKVDDIARDEKVRQLESDINAFNIEHQQLQTELDKLRSRLDEEVERYRTVAETKRTRTESIERELSLAKKEFSDANKEYKNAENRRKKELSSAEKRLRDVAKRIKKAEDSRDKRIRDLEKERLKREEEAKKA